LLFFPPTKGAPDVHVFVYLGAFFHVMRGGYVFLLESIGNQFEIKRLMVESSLPMVESFRAE
jgi:hypothetical protein